MQALIRQHLLAFACLTAAGILCIAAVVDHRWKQRRMDRAEIAAWYCTHEGTHCGGESWRQIENRWNRRQLGYEIAAATLSSLALALIVVRAFRPRERPSSSPSRGGG